MNLDVLDDLAARLRAMPTLGPAIAREAAPLVLAEAKRTANAGTTPDGKPWASKKDGGRPLERAADAITVKAAGDVIVLSLTGVNVYHHHGVKGGAPARPILPNGADGLPPKMAEAIMRAARDVIERAA